LRSAPSFAAALQQRRYLLMICYNLQLLSLLYCILLPTARVCVIYVLWAFVFLRVFIIFVFYLCLSPRRIYTGRSKGNGFSYDTREFGAWVICNIFYGRFNRFQLWKIPSRWEFDLLRCTIIIPIYELHTLRLVVSLMMLVFFILLLLLLGILLSDRCFYLFYF